MKVDLDCQTTKQPNTPIRKRQPRAVREGDILSSAHVVFSDKGYEKAAVSEIAKRAGIAEGTVFKYFTNKQTLLARVIAEFYKKLIETTEASLHGITGVENQLRVVISRHIHTFFEDIGLCRLLLQEVRPLNSYPHSEMHLLTRRYSEILLNVLDLGVSNGEIRPDVSPKTIRNMIFGCLEHAGWNVLANKKTVLNHETLVNEIIMITLGGVSASSVETAPLSAPIQATSDKQKAAFELQIKRMEGLVDRIENKVN